MFHKDVVISDLFLSMPLTTQALYFHLGMAADDDGFLASAKSIIRIIGAAEDDLKLLIIKKFIIPFESGIIVIRHWKQNNDLKKDRYHETIFLEEKSMLVQTKTKTYAVIPKCIQNVSSLEPQIRLESSSLLSTQGNSYTTNLVSTDNNKSEFKDVEEKDLTAPEIALLKEAKWDFKILNAAAKIYEDNSKTTGNRLSRVKKNLFYVQKKYFGKNKPNDLGAYLYSAICGNYQV